MATLIRLDRAALEEMMRYFSKNPSEVEKEAQTHGVNPILHPDRFFSDELLEPIHQDVLEAVVKNRGVLMLCMMKKWIAEEAIEKLLPAIFAAKTLNSQQGEPMFVLEGA